MQEAFNGNSSRLSRLNEQGDFVYFHEIKSEDGQTAGIVRVDGEHNEDYAQYELSER